MTQHPGLTGFTNFEPVNAPVLAAELADKEGDIQLGEQYLNRAGKFDAGQANRRYWQATEV